MRDIPAEMIIASTDAGALARLDLFEVDLQPFGGDVLRFYSGTNSNNTDLIWKDLAYRAWPISVEGFDIKSEGTYSRPTMTISNLDGLVTGVNRDFYDAVGATVTRRQVDVIFLDAVNFPNGNPDADPTKEAVSRYSIEEMTEETFETVTYTLSTAIDSDTAVIPAGTILANVCQWSYRGDGCRYSGPPVADEKDRPTSDAAKDRCSKHLTGCRLRFPRPAPMPFGAYPGVSKIS